ncbi:hypothetical protein P8H26_08975 [Pseudochrobactrum sp. sp1633]|uniref:hypothetical protein n=1 Tax=Pseudochrobactrum sp. sp1633 TaxID=3036706 RepID=UPI0025A5ACB9|nr:hypothetical protein [Pseudochrobactrum sp. sp1633]MDM8345526.1 hypothetical protein [Pseudochrobactrum sp. sp1633]HWD13153.1 hypothetical protein [Pseudochrobactrum sp.]
MSVKLSAAVHGRYKPVLKGSVLILAIILAGCTSQSSGGNSAALAPLTADFGQPASQAKEAPVNMDKVRKYQLYIAPIIGAPLEVVTPLSFRFDTIIQTQSIPLVKSADTVADYTLKGYFSNIVESNQTTVLYVWDVMDKQGNRVHRLQGQQKAAGKSGWASITAPIMNKIADDTMAEYFRWVSANAQ